MRGYLHAKKNASGKACSKSLLLCSVVALRAVWASWKCERRLLLLLLMAEEVAVVIQAWVSTFQSSGWAPRLGRTTCSGYGGSCVDAACAWRLALLSFLYSVI